MERGIVSALTHTRATSRTSDLKEMRREVLDAHTKYFWPNPAWKEGQPTVGALMVLRDSAGGVSLLHCLNGVVTEHDDYASVGIGSGMADYWKRILLPGGCKSDALETLTALAAFIVWQTKESVPGCGGRTALATFRHGGGYTWTAARFTLNPLPLEVASERVLAAFGVLVSALCDQDSSVDEALGVFSAKVNGAVLNFRTWYQETRRVVRVPKQSPEKP
jgi:hypothetical protein